MIDWQSIFICIAIGTLVSWALVPWLRRIAPRVGLVDNPAHRKIHKQPVPYLGGVAIFAGFAAALGYAIYFVRGHSISAGEVQKLIWVGGAGISAMALGVIDDRFQIRARYKLLGQVIITALFVVVGYRFQVLTFPLIQSANLEYLALPLTAIWILAIVNGMNLIDGLDGLGGSVAAVIFFSTACVAFYLNDLAAAWISVCAFSGVLGFLYFNWRPAKIYMGDAGSIGMGMLIATLLVSLGQREAAGTQPKMPAEGFLYHLPSATLLAAYPLLEVTSSVFRRLLRGKSIASADRSHIHHRLVQRGWKIWHVCLAAMVLSALSSGIVFSTLIQYKGIAVLLVLITGFLTGFGLHICGYMTALTDIKDTRPHFLIANHFVSMQRVKLTLAQSLSEVIALVNQTSVEFGIHNYEMQLAHADGDEVLNHKWTRPLEAHGTYLTFLNAAPAAAATGFQDRAQHPSFPSTASWTFEPHENEEDIDVEYRLFMSEFMKRALEKAQQLFEESDAENVIDAKNYDPAAVSSNMLKRRASQKRNEVLKAMGNGATETA
jgi:UDP-GlcNAc:undecaprenyl-phosphate/decaprenyl-phosphate GlcNAc-1-phosphate transferase